MPSAAARRLYEDQIPSFMSIIDPETDGIGERDRDLVTVVEEPSGYMDMDMDMDTTYAPEVPKRAPPPPPPPAQAFFRHHQSLHQQPPLHSNINDTIHRHHDSTSTQNSESADSSPTTTLTTDTSSISDPSPSSSPDSPINLVPLNSFPATTFGGLPSTMNTLSVGGPTRNNENNPYGHLERPMTSPSPRRRNLKGLSIQPPLGGNCNMSSNLVSEPSSPSFIKPKVPAMKRKPSGLSLKTDSMGLNLKPCKLEVPSSPGKPPMLQRRALKHSTSSPHMLSAIKSATFGPAGGMTLPKVLDRGSSGLSEVLRPNKFGANPGGYDTTILEEDSPIRTQVANRAAMDFEPFRDESENNEDLKSPSYPDGPIAIYDSVYLYLEPTADEASKFDVVINVAREVSNPFDSLSSKKKQDDAESDRMIEATIESPIPDTAMTNDSFATAFEYPPSGDRMVETPTTPKANPFQEPEYIHMLWDHNTDISVDLMSLCEKIDKCTKDGKKVLVHCQQGASRSASLIIAYGLYQNPGQSVNDAYYSAQAKSKWISPNMRLMYCLQDFQKQISKKKAPPRSAAGPRSGRSPTKHRLTLSADAIDAKPTEPMTAPLPDEKGGESNNAGSGEPSSSSRPKSTPNLEGISPGPSSAPSCFSWLDKEDEKDPGRLGRFNLDKHDDEPRRFGTQLKPESLQPATSCHQQTSTSFHPPPSPGFGAHRFSGGPSGFGFGSLDAIGPAPSRTPPEPPKPTAVDREIAIERAMPDEDTLMSPRAETMTNNPMHGSFTELSGMKFIEQPPTPTEGLFSPRQTMFPRDPLNPFVRPTQITDPRSPPTRGETPITRSIDDMI